jgi:predicted lysophospholipase L1 biosynthesis ABC-type transport system permease subunit
VVAQALARQATIESETYATLNALGVSRRQLAVLGMTATFAVAVMGAIGGIALAFALSPLTPVGEARLADPSAGFAFDAYVLLPGAAAAVVVVLALGVWPAIRAARSSRLAETAYPAHPSRIVALLARAGAPPSALIGTRRALERGRGRDAVPVGPALLGSILAVTALCARNPAQQVCQLRAVISAGGDVLVRAVPGPQGQAALGRLARAYPSEVNFPVPPTNLVNFGQAVNFPILFGLALALFGVATLVHVLVVSVTRRRREAGLLKALGFLRRQVALAVSWQTTIIAAAGIVAGVPVGIAVGRLAWQAFAVGLGVVPVPVVTAWVIAAVAAGTVLTANVLAAGPALAASRSRPGSLLRTE